MFIGIWRGKVRVTGWSILLLALMTVIFYGVEQAAAQPDCTALKGKGIKWIVPYKAGGGFDAYSRLIAPHLAQNLGAKIQIENVGGSGGMIGGRKIVLSKPDGLTVGITDAPGMLAAMVCQVPKSIDLLNEFTILGRAASSSQVLVTGKDSGIKTFDDVFAMTVDKPVVFAITDVGGTNFLVAALSSYFLDLKAEYVAGYRGIPKTSLAVIRGEVDLASMPYDSALPNLENGSLRAVLQISAEPIAPHASLKGVPLLGGQQGLAASRAAKLGRKPDEAASDADAFITLTRSGRLIVAPAGLDPAVSQCLQNSLAKALAEPEMLKAAAKAKRPISPADGYTARGDVEQASQMALKFVPLVNAAIEQVRK